MSERQLKQVALRFEQFRETFARLFTGVRDTPAPVVILVFGSARAYRPFMPVYNGKPVEVGGYFLKRPDVNYITLTVEGGERAYPTIFHEYTHLLVGTTLTDVPVWFNEGLAEYYSTFEATDDGRKATLGKVVESHVYQLRERFIPLRELLAVQHDSPLYNEGERRSIFYAESWALLHYFLVHKPERRPQLVKYLELYGSGLPSERAFREAFEADEAAIERDLRRYVAQPIYQSTTYTLRDPIEIDRAAKGEPASEADAEALLGDLLLHGNRLDEASARLEQALTLEPAHPRAAAALGRVRHLQGRDGEARTLLEAASARADADPVPHYYYAMTLLRPEDGPKGGAVPDRAVATRATALLEKVVARHPTHADALALLGYARLIGEQPAKAIDALSKAFAVAPRQEYALMVAHAYVANRNLAKARNLLTLLSTRGETEAVKDGARRLLDHISSMERGHAGTATAGGGDGRPSPWNTAPRTVPVFRQVAAGETRTAGVLHEILLLGRRHRPAREAAGPGGTDERAQVRGHRVHHLSRRPERRRCLRSARRARNRLLDVAARAAGNPGGRRRPCRGHRVPARRLYALKSTALNREAKAQRPNTQRREPRADRRPPRARESRLAPPCAAR